jgi:hypothetical protein
MEHEEPLEISSRLSNINHALPFELLGADIFVISQADPLDLRYAIFVCRSMAQRDSQSRKSMDQHHTGAHIPRLAFEALVYLTATPSFAYV